jgi:hypothetical protein
MTLAIKVQLEIYVKVVKTIRFVILQIYIL